MKMTIKADKRDKGWVMIAVGRDGSTEEPQEGRIHRTRKSVYDDAEIMYDCSVWDYNPVRHTIEKADKRDKGKDDAIKVIDINDATEEQATNFYEYPSFKIFDGNHIYLLAEYQLIIESAQKYIITDDVPTINKKLSDGTLDLDWEMGAYNFDNREGFYPF